MEQRVLLVKSNKMDSNKKGDRDEHHLLRMSKTTREELGFKEDQSLELSSIKGKEAVSGVSPFKAFSEDIQKVKGLMHEGTISPEDLSRICFVSSKTFNELGKGFKGEILEADLSKSFYKMLIGTDPELLIFDQTDKVISAGNIPGMTKESKFGSDGAMAELRPDPEYSPEDLAGNIQKILQDEQLTKNVKKYKWLSACYHSDANRDFPVGTHIHFDNPKSIGKLSENERFRLFAVTNKILDEFLAIPMIRLDGPLGHNRRAKCKMGPGGGFGGNFAQGYGFFGEWRSCHGRFEYRSLSGLVIANPELCANVFGVAKAITEAVYKEAINNKLDKDFILPENFSQKSIYEKTFVEWENIPLAATFDCVKSSELMRTVMDNSSRVEIDPAYIKKWLIAIRKLPTYDKYEKYIESLGSLLSCSAETLSKIDTDLKKTWGIE